MGSEDKDSKSPEQVMREEMDKLREELKNIHVPKKPDVETTDISFSELKDSVEDLENSINHLLKVFERAGEMMIDKEEKRNEKVDDILKQNREIANGLIQVANLVKNLEQKETQAIEELKQRLEQVEQQPSNPSPSSFDNPEEPEEPPAPPEKKKGFFSRFTK